MTVTEIFLTSAFYSRKLYFPIHTNFYLRDLQFYIEYTQIPPVEHIYMQNNSARLKLCQNSENSLTLHAIRISRYTKNKCKNKADQSNTELVHSHFFGNHVLALQINITWHYDYLNPKHVTLPFLLKQTLLNLLLFVTFELS